MKQSCELYLRIPARLCATVDAAALLAPGQVSALLITAISGSIVPPEALRAFMAAAGSQNVAVLIENDAVLAKELDADGVHLRAHTGAVDEARKLLGGEKVVGVSCPLTRHDAMEMAEAGASYIAFGEGDADDAETVAAMIRWWDEIFEIPCVGWVHEGHDEETLCALIRAGANFLSVPFPRVLGAGAMQEIARLARLCACLGAPD
jgi:thiamine-phosphate pyrophosphorylase